MSELHIVDQLKDYTKRMEGFVDKYLNNTEEITREEFYQAFKPFKREAEQMIELILFNLIAREDNFYGQFIIRMNRRIEIFFDAPAGVGFRGLYFELSINPILLFKHSLEEIKAILIHEIYHVCNNHITRGKIFREKYPFYLVNIAMDLAINQFINGLPSDCVFLHNIDKFVPNVDKSLILPNMNFEEYLSIFMDTYNNNSQTKEFVDNQQKGLSGQGSSSGQQGNASGTMTQEEKDGIKEAFEGDGLSKGNKLDSHDIWDSSDTTAGENESKNVARKLFNDAQQNCRGTAPAGLKQAIDGLFTPPTISWQQLLRKYVGSTPCPYKKTIMRKNRRQPSRNDLKGRLNDHIIDIVVGLDTSGSMTDADIMYALSEVCDIVKNVKHTITVVECDSEITREYKIKKKTDIQTKVTGRGGTRFSPVFEYMTKANNRNSILLYFTDGGGEWEIDKKLLKHYRTLWVLTDEKYQLSVQGLPKAHGEVKIIQPKDKRKKKK